jgi:ABC-type enterochelin transport system substrate-binding protein
MIDIDDNKADPMLAEFTARRKEGSASPLDRANTALLNASQVVTLLSEGDDTVQADAQSKVERVALAAQAVAIAERQGDQALAASFAKVAESEALVLDTFDYVKVDGLRRHRVHGL